MNLRAIAKRSTLPLICSVLMLCFLYEAGVVFRADRYQQSSDEASLRRAIVMEPGNAEHHLTLGKFLMHDKQEFDAAQRELLRAAQLNSRDSQTWLELANCYLVLGRESDQRAALENALLADPKTPQVAWAAGNYYLAIGDEAKAIEQFRTVISEDSTLAPDAILQSWRITRDVSRLLDHLVPNTVKARSMLLDILTNAEEVEAAQAVWLSLEKLPGDFDPKIAFRFTDLLLKAGKPEAAAQAWQLMGQRFRSMAGYNADGNGIVNAGFEEPVLNDGLDWRYVPNDQVRVEIDSTKSHGGAHSLSFAMTAQGLRDFGVYQFVPLTPGATYEFRAYAAADELHTSSGPQFRLEDARTGMSLMTSDEFDGSFPWREISNTFTVPAETRLAVLRIARAQAGRAITGRFWVDDISLVLKRQAD